MRQLIFAALAVVIVISTGGESAAQKKKKKDGPITGKVFAVDEDKGSIRLIVTTRNKKEKSEVDASYTIDPDTKIIINGKDKKEFTGKAGLKEIKKDDMATIVLDADFKTISVTVNPGARK